MAQNYGLAKQKFLSGAIDMITDNIKVVGVDTGAYTANFATDEFLSDIPAGARIVTTANLSAKDIALGVFDAADTVFASATGVEFEVLVVYKDTGTAGTSPLISYLDSGTGIPFTPVGTDIDVTWDNGANKIFAL